MVTLTCSSVCIERTELQGSTTAVEICGEEMMAKPSLDFLH
jgi:hypothetical protein